MLIQIKRGDLSDHELLYLHTCLKDASISCCANFSKRVDGQRICPCKAHRICKAIDSSIRYIEKQLPDFFSPTE